MLERIYTAQKMMDSACRTLRRGPGCPVCVTPPGYIDAVLELAQRDDVLIATYGDMVTVPGKSGSLERNRPATNVKVVLSSEDALELARQNPDKAVVFVAVGFETTAPATAVAVREAAKSGIENFTVLSGHKLVVPAMRTLVSEKNDRIDAFLCPGHVAAIIGYAAFGEIVDSFQRPCVVAGFEPVQIMTGLGEICRQLSQGRACLKSIYDAVVTAEGNITAQQIMDECFEAVDGYWRGLGKIEKSTLKLKAQYSDFDAAERFAITEEAGEDTSGCRCGEVLCGLIEPPQCGLFGGQCVPENPVGPCMVSSEGACAAWFKYGGNRDSR